MFVRTQEGLFLNLDHISCFYIDKKAHMDPKTHVEYFLFHVKADVPTGTEHYWTYECGHYSSKELAEWAIQNCIKCNKFLSEEELKNLKESVNYNDQRRT